MDWKPAIPRKPGFYWVLFENNFVSILKRSGKTQSYLFAGEPCKTKGILWGEQIDLSPIAREFVTYEPEEDAWYAVLYDDKTKGVVRVTKGQRLHVYDFDLPAEIDIRNIVGWDGPLKPPALPPPKK